MLGVTINGVVFAKHTIKHAGGLFIIYFSLFSEVDASDPLVLYFLKRWLDLHDDRQLVEHVPKYLVLPVNVAILRCLAYIG